MPEATNNTIVDGGHGQNEIGAGHNILTDMAALKAAVTSIEKKMKTLDTLRGEYMAECKAIRDDIKDCYIVAKDKGVQKRALRMLIVSRELKRKQDRLFAELDAEIVAEYEAYADAVDQWQLPL